MSDTNEKKKTENAGKSEKAEKEKCFVIMPISDQGDYPQGHFTKVYEQIIKPAIEESGYEAYRVDENNICDAIIGKIFSAIQECPMAVCDLSNRNPNVLYELGLRQAYDKPVVLIQDEKTERIFDVSGISTVRYESTRLYEDVLAARENIKRAILSTKEGKNSTLAKIIKVNSADFSKLEVSQADQANVMLKGIYDAIRELKNKEEVNLSPSIVRHVLIKIFGECSDPENVNSFKAFLGKAMADLERISVKSNGNIYRFHFYFYDYSRDKTASNIEKIKFIRNNANEFGIKLNDDYEITTY